MDCRRRRAINSADVSRAHDRARGFHHDAGAGQARGGHDPQRVGHREGQRDTAKKPAAPTASFSPSSPGPSLSTTRRPRPSRPISTSTATARTAGSSRSSSRSADYGNGINGFTLDPDYAKNGKFYTTHMEDPSIEAPGGPQNTMFPGLQASGYTTTAPITTPGPVMHQGVLIEWTDTNPSNNTFEGTAREMFRVWLNTRNHQLGEVIFNPTAKPWRRRLARAVCRRGRRRLRRIEKPADASESAAARHDGRQDRAHHS